MHNPGRGWVRGPSFIGLSPQPSASDDGDKVGDSGHSGNDGDNVGKPPVFGICLVTLATRQKVYI